jgi:hypothetical protein
VIHNHSEPDFEKKRRDQRFCIAISLDVSYKIRLLIPGPTLDPYRPLAVTVVPLRRPALPDWFFDHSEKLDGGGWSGPIETEFTYQRDLSPFPCQARGLFQVSRELGSPSFFP